MPGTSATLAAEWSFLQAACSEIPRLEKLDLLRLLLREPLRWNLLLDLAERHGAQPLLCQALVDIEEAVPPAELSVLRRRYQINLHRALFLSRELIRIVECLCALGIEVMPYKGVALAELAYRDIAFRHAGDIDLLIRPQDFPRVRDAVRELGYRPHLSLSAVEGRAYLKSGYECAFDGAAGPNLLEVQWAIQPSFYAVDFDMDALFQRAVTITVAGHPMKTLSSEDLLLVLSAHATKHVWGRLIWLCDIARIMALPVLDWTWIASQAKALG
ncbi:MAG: nucleotidyltransferase family protein, partial [Candidatus Sulfotelmatobacter sp.]